MSLSIEIQKKEKDNNIELRKVIRPQDVFELSEVQEIKDAIQEHLLLICLDTANYIKNISLIGVGNINHIQIDSKDIIRTALITASDKVILVHNHPANELKTSNLDIRITNVINKLLKAFNIELIDHIIVSEQDYKSMVSENQIDMEYEDNTTIVASNICLVEENKRLKQEIINLNNKLKEYENEEEFE